jgi:hypothetical protein
VADDVLETLRWIDEQHRAARAECERLLAADRARPPGRTPGDVRTSMQMTVDVAAATARLETWNELRGELTRLLASV